MHKLTFLFLTLAASAPALALADSRGYLDELSARFAKANAPVDAARIPILGSATKLTCKAFYSSSQSLAEPLFLYRLRLEQPDDNGPLFPPSLDPNTRIMAPNPEKLPTAAEAKALLDRTRVSGSPRSILIEGPAVGVHKSNAEIRSDGQYLYVSLEERDTRYECHEVCDTNGCREECGWSHLEYLERSGYAYCY
jgi:hypothetical protein